MELRLLQNQIGTYADLSPCFFKVDWTRQAYVCTQICNDKGKWVTYMVMVDQDDPLHLIRFRISSKDTQREAQQKAAFIEHIVFSNQVSTKDVNAFKISYN